MYEPYIFAALNSAKIMLVIGGKKEHFEATWVKNEWSRFIDLMKTRPDRYLIPCYRDMDAYEMPEQFLVFQGQDMSKLGFMQDLIRGIDKIMGRTEAHKVQPETKIIQSDVNIQALLKRAEILIEDSQDEKADELLERVLDNDPTNSQAYLLKLVIELECHNVEDLKELNIPINSYNNYIRAYDYGDEAQKNRLSSINEYILNKNESLNKELTNTKLLIALYEYGAIHYVFEKYCNFFMQKEIYVKNDWFEIINELESHEFPKKILNPSDMIDFSTYFTQLDYYYKDGFDNDKNQILNELEQQSDYKTFYSGKLQYEYATNRDMNFLGSTKSVSYKNSIQSSDKKYKKFVKDVSLPDDILEWARDYIINGTKYNWVASILKQGFFKNSFEDLILYDFRVQECVEFAANKIKKMNDLNQEAFNRAVQFLEYNFSEHKKALIEMAKIAEDLEKYLNIPFDLKKSEYLYNLTNLVYLSDLKHKKITLNMALTQINEIIRNRYNWSGSDFTELGDKILSELNNEEKQEVENFLRLFRTLYIHILDCSLTDRRDD